MSEPSRDEQHAPETEGQTIRWWARYYDLFSNVILLGRGKEIHRRVVRAAKLSPGEAVLDVGCGTGTLGLMMEEAVGVSGRVEGIDASPEMIVEARKKVEKNGSGSRFQIALVEEIPFQDDTFDVVVSTFMFHHLPDGLKRDGLAEIRRVLKPDGRFLLVDFSADNQSLVGHLLSIFGGHSHGGDGDLISMIEDAGFANVRRLKSKRPEAAIVASGPKA